MKKAYNINMKYIIKIKLQFKTYNKTCYFCNISATICVYLRTKFKVSSIILRTFRRERGCNFTKLNEPLKSSPRLWLRTFLL